MLAIALTSQLSQLGQHLAQMQDALDVGDIHTLVVSALQVESCATNVEKKKKHFHSHCFLKTISDVCNRGS